MKKLLFRKTAFFLLPAALIAICATPAKATTFGFSDEYYVGANQSSTFQTLFGTTVGYFNQAGIYQLTQDAAHGGAIVTKLSNGSGIPGEFVQNTTPNVSQGLALYGFGQSLNNGQQVGSVYNSTNPGNGAVLYFRYMTGASGGYFGNGTTTAFTFNSFDLKLPVNANIPFTLEGFLGGVMVDSAVLDVTSNTFSTFTENWKNVDTVEVVSTASLPVNWGSGTLYMDNVVLNNPVVSATPEPSSLLLLGTGLVGIAGFARSKMSRSQPAA